MIIRFPPDYSDDLLESNTTRYRLFELNDDILLNGDEFTIKGDNDDELILCTEDTTFRLREVNTSNQSIIYNTEAGDVVLMTKNYLEANRTPGRVDQLRLMLQAAPFNGPENETCIPTELLSPLHLTRIYKEVQASDEEIRKALHRYGAILFDGHYRMAGSHYLCRFFRSLFASINLIDATTKEVLDYSVIKGSFDEEEFPTSITEQLLQAYGIPSPDQDWKADGQYKLDASKVRRFFAEELLKAKNVWIQSEFLLAWGKLIGDFEPHLEDLSGLVLFNSVPGQDDPKLTYLPPSSLPLDVVGRLTKLFEIRRRWDLDTMLDFCSDLSDSRAAVMEKMVKLARISSDSTSSAKRIVTPLVPTA